MFLIQRVGAPVPMGPIYMYPSAPMDCSSGQDDVDCQYNCSLYIRETIDTDWDEEMPVSICILN